MRYQYKLNNFATGKKNRAQNCLTVSNIQLEHVFSYVFGKASSALKEQNLPFNYARNW
jgi:transposase